MDWSIFETVSFRRNSMLFETRNCLTFSVDSFRLFAPISSAFRPACEMKCTTSIRASFVFRIRYKGQTNNRLPSSNAESNVSLATAPNLYNVTTSDQTDIRWSTYAAAIFMGSNILLTSFPAMQSNGEFTMKIYFSFSFSPKSSTTIFFSCHCCSPYACILHTLFFSMRFLFRAHYNVAVNVITRRKCFLAQWTVKLVNQSSLCC